MIDPDYSDHLIPGFDRSALPQVKALRATALSDKSVRLTWESSPGAKVDYNIYRSTDPRDPPTAYTLVGKSTAPEFVDDCLKIGTRYYYRVAAISAHNNQGRVSHQVAVRTRDRNTSPPAPIRGLGVVREEKSLIVYWRKSPEPDVASYHIYRCANRACPLNQSDLLAAVSAQPYFLQTYSEDAVRGGWTYFYKVVAEDWAGNRQTTSPTAQGTLSPHSSH